jgi:hypothetical protein
MSDHWYRLGFLNNTLSKGNAKILPNESTLKIPYPRTDPGVGLQSVTRLIDAKLGLQYAWIDQSGWDTHERSTRKIEFAN